MDLLIFFLSKKLCIPIFFCVFVVKINLLQKIINMHNFSAKYAKDLDICKYFPKNFVDHHFHPDEKEEYHRPFRGEEAIFQKRTRECLTPTPDQQNTSFTTSYKQKETPVAMPPSFRPTTKCHTPFQPRCIPTASSTYSRCILRVKGTL